jgi:SAM-dependent methyltransferase
MRRKKVFANLDPALRKKISESVWMGRKRDRGELKAGQNWLCQERTLEGYYRRLGIHPQYLETFLKNRMADKKKVQILDIGVGYGRALFELTQKFGKNFSVCGIALTPRSFPNILNYRHRVGLIETLSLEKNFYDLIFSVRGGFSYTMNSFAALEETLNALSQGGMALLEDSRLLLTQDWFREYLTNQNFATEVTRYDAGRAVASRILRLSEKSLELSSFSERYLSILNENKSQLTQWGLDRVEERDILNIFFQDAYALDHYRDLIIT